MKRLVFIFSILCAAHSCGNFAEPYSESLCTLTVRPQYPSGFPEKTGEGAKVVVEDVNQGNTYKLYVGSSGTVSFRLMKGLHRIRVSDVGTADIFNGSVNKLNVDSDGGVDVPLTHSKAGSIVIKEIYCGGCMKYPEQGNYQSDQYIILHNNYPETRYLDGLCFGTLAPYNSNASNPFLEKDPQTGEAKLPDFLPIIQAVWQFGGDGDDFPLDSGADAVLCLRGAIDHSTSYPLSVNLNREGYFVCYNETYFTNPAYHPAPGNKISPERILDVVVKTGQANAYTFSINSPTAVIFTAPEGMTMKEYVQSPGAIIQVPGSTSDRVVKIDPEWVVDAVEVFNGSSASNSKRLLPALDAGYVSQSATFLGHTLFRNTDEELSESLGYEVLMDTNNSSEDFYERESQSLHE